MAATSDPEYEPEPAADPATESVADETDDEVTAPDADTTDRDDDTLDDVAPRVDEVRETNRWTGISALAFLAASLGIVLARAGLLLSAAVGVAYVAYVRVGTPPGVDLRVDRTLSATHPDPGDDVTVTVRVTNEGSFLPDVRLVDGVPGEFIVTDGVPRLATALRHGETARFSYTVTVTRGEHTFEELGVVARDLSGSLERETTVPTDTTVKCYPVLSAPGTVPLRSLTTRYTGRVSTDTGGEGLEFYSTREYRHGDPLSRIDWNRRARTGKMATVEFRQERAATVVLLVDTREEAYVRPDEDSLHAADRCVTAATQVFASLLDSGDRVGVASYGPEDCWLAPGSGSDHRVAAQRLFTSHPAFSPDVSSGRFVPPIERKLLRKRFPADAQVIFFTPLVDDGVVRTARLFDAYGHLVTVVSPDPTTDETPGGGVARAERAGRITDLREAGLRVVDMPGDASLATALARAGERWSR